MMMTTCISRRALVCTLFASSALTTPALAQEASIVPFPVRAYADENGVDLLSGVFTAYSPSIRIGSADMGLGYTREVRGKAFRDTMMGTISISGSTYTVDVGGKSEAFTLAGGVFTPVEQNGSTLVLSGSTYTYTRDDGTAATFASTTYIFGNASGISIATLQYPSGRSLAFYYTTTSYTPSGGTLQTGRRLQSVTTNAGYHMKLSYESDATPTTSYVAWARVAKVKGLNSATDTCAVTAFSCPQTGRPELTIPTPVGGGPTSTSTQSYIDSEGRITTFTLGSNIVNKVVTGIKLPGSASDNIAITYTSGLVTSITRFGVTTGYGYADVGNVRTVTVTRPGGSTRVVTFDLTKLVMLTDRDELNRTVSYQYDTNNRPTRVTLPEGNYTQQTYNARGNVIESRTVSKAGSGLADIVATAAYPAACANAVTCNHPTSTTDPKGNVTDYTYDTTHGGSLTVTEPAASGGANRKQTRVTYSKLDANGAASGSGIFVPTASSTCQTGISPTCLGTSDEVKTTVGYGYGLLPSMVSSGAGDNSLTATQTMTYDLIGNLITVDGPLSGTADTTLYRYNFNRERIGAVSPDPDGAGTLKNRAQRVTADPSGLAIKIEQGTVNSQSDADWAAFASLQEVQQDYDANRRPIVQRIVASGTIYALTQTNYDTRGRTDCVATRMNPAIFASLPASACSLGTQGSAGPDRISKSVYNNASEVTQTQVAVGTTAQANEQSLTYSSNGKLATLTDGELNKTTYEYDGFDRLLKTRFALPTTGSNASSNTDYEQLTYDANSKVTSRRLRDATSIAFTYDALNRPTLKDLPGTEPDVTYAYDLLGRLISASQTGNALSFTYDALSRNLTQTGPQGTSTSAWDLASRRTQLTYPGSGLYVNTDYLVTGETTAIRENGATSGIGVLATFVYNNLGRRTSLIRGNGSTTSYSFDPVSRLTAMAQDLTSSTNDLTIGTITYSPASQMIATPRSNDLYAWTGHYNVNRDYTANGLNQYFTAGPANFTYDSRGNLTSDGSLTLTYDSENKLISASGSKTAALSYDPMKRLYQTFGAATTRFAYDGVDMIAEYDAANALQRRFVHGPGSDEPLVQYEGTGTTDRRWLHADERGSIVAVSDASGNALTINTYDEYGTPATTNAGRFQYTGQMWLAELGMQYSKARLFSPTLGRFLQTDPIDVMGGVNLYAYVGNDPINFVDPVGLCGGQEYPIAVPTTIPKNPDPGSVYATYRIVCMRIPSHDKRNSGGSGGGGGGAGGGDKSETCRRAVARLGQTSENLGMMGQFLGGEVVLFSAGEALFFGTMTGGPGALAAVPTLGAGIRLFSAGSALSAFGSFLKGVAGDKSSWMNAITSGVVGIGAHASGMDKYSSAIVSISVEGSTKQVEVQC
jgi:RHS repeat-associated protein